MSSTLVETPRLVVRSFVPEDAPAIHRILDLAFGDGSLAADPAALDERRSWVNWSMLSHQWFPRLYQPPYGERAIVLKETGDLIGAVGYVPCLAPFDQLPALGGAGGPSGYATPEFGLFWAIDPAHQGRGYATEAARGVIEHAFRHLRLKRIIATTEYGNLASQGVMRKLGMRIERNPLPDPHYLQIVGILNTTDL